MTPFSDWLRGLVAPLDSRSVDYENVDGIWFHYRPGWFVTFEEKRFGASPSPAQQDTHKIVAQLLTIASGSEVMTWRGKRKIEYRGHYLIVFEKTTPDDSQWIKVNGRLTSKQELMQLLRTGRLGEVVQVVRERPALYAVGTGRAS